MICLQDVLTSNSGSFADSGTKLLAKLAGHFYDDADLMYEIFLAEDNYMLELIQASCQISQQDFSMLGRALMEHYEMTKLRPIREQIDHRRAQAKELRKETKLRLIAAQVKAANAK